MMAYTGLRDRQQGMINTYTNQLKTKFCEESKFFFDNSLSVVCQSLDIFDLPHLQNEAQLLQK